MRTGGSSSVFGELLVAEGADSGAEQLKEQRDHKDLKTRYQQGTVKGDGKSGYNIAGEKDVDDQIRQYTPPSLYDIFFRRNIPVPMRRNIMSCRSKRPLNSILPSQNSSSVNLL